MKKLTNEQVNMIKQKISLNNQRQFVRLNVAGNKLISNGECNNNVYCIDKDYEILWQIKAKKTAFDRDPFVSMKFDNSVLTVKNFTGFKYKVDLETGEVEEIGFEK